MYVDHASPSPTVVRWTFQKRAKLTRTSLIVHDEGIPRPRGVSAGFSGLPACSRLLPHVCTSAITAALATRAPMAGSL
jgi:hypothetical protein